MTTRDERLAALDQLEAALRADGGDAKNVHVREAMQLLHIESDDGANGIAK